MTRRIYLSRDSAALALGADDVAQALVSKEKLRGEEIE